MMGEGRNVEVLCTKLRGLTRNISYRKQDLVGLTVC